MKKNKWTKWTVGALGALGMIALFHEIKDSPAYAAAVAKAKPGGGKQAASAAAPQDSNGDLRRPNPSDQALGDDNSARMQRPRRHRGDAFGSSDGGGSRGTSPNSSGSGPGSGPDSGSSGMTLPQTVQPHARTTRS